MGKKVDPPANAGIINELDTALHLTLDRAEAAEAELARTRARLDDLMSAFEKNGSLGVLQHIAHDKNLPVDIRMRAATAAVPFERPKYGTVDGLAVGVIDFKERVRAARLKQLELDKAEWAAQEAKAEPKKPLDWDAPTPRTILGQGPDDPSAA